MNDADQGYGTPGEAVTAAIPLGHPSGTPHPAGPQVPAQPDSQAAAPGYQPPQPGYQPAQPSYQPPQPSYQPLPGQPGAQAGRVSAPMFQASHNQPPEEQAHRYEAPPSHATPPSHDGTPAYGPFRTNPPEVYPTSGAGAAPTSGAAPISGAAPTSGAAPISGAAPTSGAAPISGAAAYPTSGAGIDQYGLPATGGTDQYGLAPSSGAGIDQYGLAPSSGAGIDQYGLAPSSGAGPDPFSAGAPGPFDASRSYSGPRIEPTPKQPKSRFVIPAVAGLVAGLLIFGTGGWFLGRATAPDKGQTAVAAPTPTPTPSASAGAYESNQIALNKPKFTGGLTTMGEGWLSRLSSCSRNGDKGGPALNKGEKSRVRCELDSMSVIFVEYASTADRDKARVTTLGQNVDARKLAPGASAPTERATPSARTNGNYVEYAYQVSGRTVAGIWWDDTATPVAAYALAYWKEGIGQKWDPLREVWADYA